MGKADIENMISEELPPRRESHEVTGSRPLVVFRFGESAAIPNERHDPEPTVELAVPPLKVPPGGSARSLASIARRALARLKR